MRSRCASFVFRGVLFLVLAVAFLAHLSGLSLADSLAVTDPAWQHEIEKVIERYLQNNPEAIEQALHILQAKRIDQERQRVKAVITTKQEVLLHDPASPVSGNPAGDVTLVEFFDYRCGFCKRVASAVTQLQKDDAQIRVVYKDLPILGEASETAAKAALASVVQGKHQAFHEALLGWSGSLTKKEILDISEDIGLDVDRLQADMSNPKWDDVIEHNRALAKDLGISGTPGFIVGKELVPGAMDLEGLKDLIARARK
jgi:protein-disulfide isomerase